VAVELPRNPANRIDLLITDVELKDGDGISLAEETNALRKDAPVLVMSGCREYQAEPPNRILLFCRNFFESGNFWMQ
jgi:two-component SAPR family response regulator